MAEAPSEPVASQPPAEIAPEITKNAAAPPPPATPPKPLTPEQVVPDEPEPSTPGLSDENDKALFGPSLLPNQPITAGVRPGRTGLTVPRELLDAVPLLTRIAQRPDAPPEVMQILTAIAREMN